MWADSDGDVVADEAGSSSDSVEDAGGAVYAGGGESVDSGSNANSVESSESSAAWVDSV